MPAQKIMLVTIFSRGCGSNECTSALKCKDIYCSCFCVLSQLRGSIRAPGVVAFSFVMSAPSLIAQHLRMTGRAFLSWQRARTASARHPFVRRCDFTAALAVLTSVSIASASMLLGIAPTLAQEQPRSNGSAYVTNPLPTPTLSAVLESLRQETGVEARNGFVRTGDTLLSVFSRLGITDEAAISFIRSDESLRAFVLPQPGQYVNAGVLPDGRIAYLRIYLEGPHERDSRMIAVKRDGEIFTAENRPFAFDTLEESISGTASGSFSQTVRTLGIPDTVAEQLRDVWEGEHNPVRDLKTGDALRLIYERKFADGTFIRNGQLLAAQVVSGNDVHEAYWFADGIRAGSFYTLLGRSSKQTFMRVPLDVHDVSSEFSPLRRHPVTGVVRPHNGTDFRAPSGSRVFAAADGIVTFVGYEARGYGRYVKIDHGLGRTTLYAHMSRIQKGLRNGQRIEKGQVIGYVGRTGLATGPHLHYELMLDGVQINPRTADLPDTENLSAFQLAQLRTIAEPMQIRFDLLAQSESQTPPTALKAHLEPTEASARLAAARPNDDAKSSALQTRVH